MEQYHHHPQAELRAIVVWWENRLCVGHGVTTSRKGHTTMWKAWQRLLCMVTCQGKSAGIVTGNVIGESFLSQVGVSVSSNFDTVGPFPSLTPPCSCEQFTR